MAKIEGIAVVAQGGGPTAVINQSLIGVVLESRKYQHISKVYGAIHGVRGIINEDFLDLTEATTHNLETVARTPCSAMLSTRDKPDAEYCARIFEVLKAHNVRFFFYIGGNDSADTCRIVNENAISSGYELRTIHIPKTIDNDLLETDHTPGYGSAAKFVSLAFSGCNLDNMSIPGCYIGIVMGRHAGFLTAASVFAKRFPDDGPHLIYLPERPFSIDRFLDDLDEVYKKHGRVVVAVSEGISDENGRPIMEKLLGDLEKDEHGNVQLSGLTALGDGLVDLVKKNTGIGRVRADTFGYLQRSYPTIVSGVDAHEAREVGEKAVQYSALHDVDGSVVIRRVGDYAVEYELVDLSKVARHTKSMPDEFISESGNMVTLEFRNYAGPLIGDMPVLDRIVAPKVDKILNK